MTINAGPGSARHAAPRNSHSAVAGAGTQRRCPRCRLSAPAVQFHTCHEPELPDKPVVKRVDYRVVVDPVTAAIFGRRD